MNTSLQSVLFSLLFATLLMLASANSAEDVEPTVEEVIVPEIVEQPSNVWPMQLRGLRSSNGKPTFIRFGKRGSPSFIRFGRK